MKSAEGSATSKPPVHVAAGTFVLCLETVQDASHLPALVKRLNALAAEDGLPPLFVVRTLRSGFSQLVFGWDGEQGIVRDGTVTAWVKKQGHWPDAYWVNLQ